MATLPSGSHADQRVCGGELESRSALPRPVSVPASLQLSVVHPVPLVSDLPVFVHAAQHEVRSIVTYARVGSERAPSGVLWSFRGQISPARRVDPAGNRRDLE